MLHSGADNFIKASSLEGFPDDQTGAPHPGACRSEAEVSLKGTVSEAGSDVALSGASLVVKNTFTGTVAGADGNFVLVVESTRAPRASI